MRRLAATALVLGLVLALSTALIGGTATREETVAFNVETKKYHCLDCRWAIKCTRNCVQVPISEARRRGGVACKVCGGSCR